MSEGGSEARFLCSELGVFSAVAVFPPTAREPAMRAKLTPKTGPFRVPGFFGKGA